MRDSALESPIQNLGPEEHFWTLCRLLSLTIWSADETDHFRVADDSGVERGFVRAPGLPGTLFLIGTGYQESKLES
jgi:hypothetical protein